MAEWDVDEDGSSAGHDSGGGAKGRHGAASAPPTLHTHDGLQMLRLLRVLSVLRHPEPHSSHDTNGRRSHAWWVGKEAGLSKLGRRRLQQEGHPRHDDGWRDFWMTTVLRRVSCRAQVPRVGSAAKGGGE